jgi:uncharacterized membrane protein
VRARLWLLCLLTPLFCVPPSHAAGRYIPPNYTIQELPGTPNGLSNAAWIAGTLADEEGRIHAYRWKDGQLEPLPELSGFQSEAFGVNDAGEVAGRSTTDTADESLTPVELRGATPPVYFGPTGPQLITLIHSDFDGWAYALNNRRQVVGRGFAFHILGFLPFLWEDGVYQDLPEPPEMPTLGEALAINEAGQIVGFVVPFADPSAPPQAIFWEGATSARLLSGPAGSSSTAYGINATGFTVGSLTLDAATEQSVTYPVGWQTALDGTATALADSVPGTAYAVNSQGVAVGTTAAGATIFGLGEAFGLLPRVTNGEGWQLATARAINDNGLIIGTGFFNGEARGFLLTPVPR